MSESPSAAPRQSESQGPATLPVRRLGRFVDGHSTNDLPTQHLPNSSPPNTPQPRLTPPLGSNFPSVDGYDIVRQLGRGGMGVVYLARERALNRWVALKVVVGGVFAGGEALERFQREAEAVAALQHPNIIQIFNVGVSSPGQDSASTCPFIALEYADGGTLAAHTGKPMAPRIAAEIVATLAEAVQYAHSRGIIHRDLKPGNVLMRVDSPSADNVEGVLGRMTPKVTDFGLAKRVDANGTAIQDGSTTVAGSTLGTPEYMAPEQAQGDGNVGPGVDIYALGVILFELLTARVPLQGADALDTLVRVRTQEAPLPSRFQARLPRDLDTICSRCLQKDPTRRYTTALALADDLRAWLDNRPITARPISAMERLWKWARRRPAVAALLATVLLVAIAGYFGVLWQWQRAEARAESERLALDRAGTALTAAENNLYFGRISVAQRELAIGNPWDAVRLLDLCRPKNNGRDLRSWEWHYLKNASHGELKSFQASEDWVWDIAYSPDGTTLATAAGSPYHDDANKMPGELRLWDAKTCRLIRQFQGHSGAVMRVGFSPDGKLLCSAGIDKTVRVWDVATGEEICSPQTCHIGDRYSSINFGDAGPCWFTPDGQCVNFYDPERVWQRLNIATGEVVPMPSMADVLAQSFDGRFFLRLQKNLEAEVVESATGQTIGLAVPPRGFNRFAVKPDGKYVLLSSHEHLELFDASVNKRHRIYDLDGSWIETLAYSNDGKKIAAGGSSRTVYFWDERIHQPVMYSGHKAEVRRVVFSPDSQHLASCDRAGRVIIWDLARNPRQQLIPVQVDCSGQWAQGITADGETVMNVLPDSKVVHYDKAGRFKKDVPFPGLTHKVEYPRYDISFSPDGSQLVGPAHPDPSIVRQWNPMTGELIREYRGHSRPIMGTTWSRDGRRLATRAMDRKDQQYVTETWVWDATTGEKISEVTTTPITGMALSSDGSRFAGATRKGEIIVWEVATGKELWRGIAHRPADYDGRPNIRIFNIAFSPDDQFLATIGFLDGTVQLWKTATGEKLHEPLLARPTLTGVTFTPDCQRVVAVGYDSEVRIWDVASGRSAITLTAPTGCRRGDTAYTARPMFSLNNQKLMLLDWSGTIVVWDGEPREDNNSSISDGEK